MGVVAGHCWGLTTGWAAGASLAASAGAEAAASFSIVQELRAAGLRAEAYVGTGKMGDQFKYADKRGAAIAVIEGGDERARGEVTLKDLALGAELAKSVESRAEWVGNREAQKSVQRAALVAEIKAMLKGKENS